MISPEGESVRSRGVIGLFVHHKVAANILMMVMLVAGAFALSRLNIQFFPSFNLDFVTVRVEWRGAAAEAVEVGVTEPLEQRLKSVAGLKKMTTTSTQGIASMSLEFYQGTDPIEALDEVKQRVVEYRNLPQDAEKPEIGRVVRYDPIARLLITGGSLDELRHLAHRFERELIGAGVDKVDIIGLPKDEISIEIPRHELERANLSLDQAAARIAAQSRDASAGMVGEGEVEREVRAIEQRREPQAFGNVVLAADATTHLRLADVAKIQRIPREGSLRLFVDGQPAVELLVQRAEGGHSFRAARIFNTWLDGTRAGLPQSVALKVYDEQWTQIRDRVELLLKNGASGLAVVAALLLFFLNGRVAFWVSMVIPTAFAATLAVLWLVGGSINMISLFALIMALGIIVDDAIVVGEDAYAHHHEGEAPVRASEGGARRMFWPVMASSLTTMAAFAPLMMVSGPIGKILFDIPFVMVCVLTASLVECFLVLPAHLRGAFLHQGGHESNLRQRIDAGFERFRDQRFRPVVERMVKHSGITVALGFAVLILAMGLWAGGRVKFTFFPSPEPQILYANATFVSGSDEGSVEAFLAHLQATLTETEKELGGHLVAQAVSRAGSIIVADGPARTSSQFGSVFIELTPPDQREVRTEAFLAHWRQKVRVPAGMENFVLTPRKMGPPGGDLVVRFTGADAGRLKAAALELGTALRQVRGLYGIEDDMPYGREQQVFQLTPQGQALGLTVDDLARQLRAAFDGRLVQIFQEDADEVEVRVRLPEPERASLAALDRFSVRTPAGEWLPLASVASWHSRQGFEELRHADAQLAVEVSAALDSTQGNLGEILAELERGALPELTRKYGVRYSFEGKARDQVETFADMKTGMMLGLVLIYLILAWVFAHYGWPLIIMTMIPFGLVGAVVGHWFMGIDLTMLSMFGLFGLSGIVVNNAIVLVEFYKLQRARGLSLHDALVNASCLRLRAILLTSLTTIGGLAPLLMEQSMQAQFLIPMAASIAFGLFFTTFLALLWLPAALGVYETLHARLTRRAA